MKSITLSLAKCHCLCGNLPDEIKKIILYRTNISKQRSAGMERKTLPPPLAKGRALMFRFGPAELIILLGIVVLLFASAGLVKLQVNSALHSFH